MAMTDIYAGPGLKSAKPNDPMAKTCGGKTNARDREVVGSLPLNITNMKSIISLRISQCPKAMLWGRH